MQKTLQEIRYVPVFIQLNSSSYLPASYTESLSSTSYGYCSLPHTWKSVEKKEKKSKKPGLFKRMGAFFKEYRSELKKVTWYPKNRVIHDTGIVVAALAVCGLVIGLLDLLFTKLIIG